MLRDPERGNLLGSKDELLDTPHSTNGPPIPSKAALNRKGTLGAFDSPKNVDLSTVSFSCSVTGPCGLFYFIRGLVRYVSALLTLAEMRGTQRGSQSRRHR